MTDPSKENRVLPLTSAPTGSGKTTFLKILCELFRHKWRVDDFMTTHIYPKNYGEDLEKCIFETITSVINDPKIIEMRNATPLSRNLFESTHPCFVSFNSATPIQEIELPLLDRPHTIIISRIIFAHVNHDSSLWDIEYVRFFNKNIETLKEITNLSTVLNFFRNHYICHQIFLAVDELIFLDSNSEGKNSKIIQNAIKKVSSTILTMDGFHTLISSLVTDPFQEYLKNSQYTPKFIHLSPLLRNLDIVSKFLSIKRNDSTEMTIWQLLLATGGHPKLLRQVIDWLVNVPKEYMDISHAIEIEGLHLSPPNAFPANIQRLIFVGGVIPSDQVSSICGLSGMLCRPFDTISQISVTVPPLVLYHMISRTSNFFNRNKSNYDKLKYLVPFRISSGNHFEDFLACWFGFQFELGRSLRSLFVEDQERCSSFLQCTNLFNLQIENSLFQCNKKFLKSLPNFETSKMVLDLKTTGTVGNYFDLESPSEGYRVFKIENVSNPGFDFMINYSTIDKVYKKVLLVQCKTKLVTTSEFGGQGQKVSTQSFVDSLVLNNEFATSLESKGWEVSLLCVYSCKTSNEVIPDVCPANVSTSFYERSAAIGNTGLFTLLGDNFGLALELAKGHKFTKHVSTGLENDI